MAPVANIITSPDINITPSRKRKRQFERQELQLDISSNKTAAASSTSCFTNAAFSSTPKKILAKRRLNSANNKENNHTFAATVGLEVKSIPDIVKTDERDDQIPVNPFEVLRKPPKKKKKAGEEAACFENPALNLDLPEKQFNPYEIVREKSTSATSNNCFVNPALNLKTQDVPASCNPFEIRRDMPKEVITSPPMPCRLKIGLPFVPTIGCRIDFKDISMSQLTPSKLMTDKLVFSPVIKGKTSLGSIGEETAMDIGKELDRYQLELENSINEAKLRKNGTTENSLPSPIVNSVRVEVEQSSKITKKLTAVKEDEETEEIAQEVLTTTENHTEIQVHQEPLIQKDISGARGNPFNETQNVEQPNVYPQEAITNKNPFSVDDEEFLTTGADLTELYGCGEDDDVDTNDSFDFRAPAAFVRAYIKPSSPKLRVSKNISESNENTDKNSVTNENAKKSLNVKNIIRKSIRKLIHPQQNKHEEEDHLENEKHSLGLINTIRHSLRRKPVRTLLKDETLESKDCELSIIDGSERTMKYKSQTLQTEYVKIEDLTNEKKHNIRSSIRRSTREVGHHLMKTVFHKKHEEYDFGK